MKTVTKLTQKHKGKRITFKRNPYYWQCEIENYFGVLLLFSEKAIVVEDDLKGVVTLNSFELNQTFIVFDDLEDEIHYKLSKC